MSEPIGPFAGVDWSELPKPQTIESAKPGVSGQLVTGIGLITFVSWRETSGTAAAAFSLWDGTDISGERLMTMGILTSDGSTTSPGFPGLYFERGIFFEVRSGACVVTVTYIPLLNPLP